MTVERVQGVVDRITFPQLLTDPLRGQLDGPARGQEVTVDAFPRILHPLGAIAVVAAVELSNLVGVADIATEAGHRGHRIATRHPRVQKQLGEPVLGGQAHIRRQGPADAIDRSHQTD